MAVKVVDASETLTHLALSGQLTGLGVERMAGDVYEQVAGPGVDAIVDLADVPFLASAGISMLLHCRKQLARNGAKLVLLSPTTNVEKTLRAARIDKLLPIVHTLDDAKRALSGE